MKYLNLLMVALTISFIACNEEENDVPIVATETGSLKVQFDHRVGKAEMKLSEEGSTTYAYTDAKGQQFNLTRFGYYVSKIKLEGPNGELYEDEMKVGASAEDVKGYYHVLESDAASQFITLKGVPSGKYNKVTFTLGVDEDGMKDGAVGGVLDPAEGAWFWNWNAGYIGFIMEGASPDSPQEEVDGGGFKIYANSFAIHVGGWKEVEPLEGQPKKFTNNVKVLTLDFDADITVSPKLGPKAHIIVDALKILDRGEVDFSTTYAVHSPVLGKPIAEQLSGAFILDHTHQ